VTLKGFNTAIRDSSRWRAGRALASTLAEWGFRHRLRKFWGTGALRKGPSWCSSSAFETLERAQAWKRRAAGQKTARGTGALSEVGGRSRKVFLRQVLSFATGRNTSIQVAVRRSSDDGTWAGRSRGHVRVQTFTRTTSSQHIEDAVGSGRRILSRTSHWIPAAATSRLLSPSRCPVHGS